MGNKCHRSQERIEYRKLAVGFVLFILNTHANLTLILLCFLFVCVCFEPICVENCSSEMTGLLHLVSSRLVNSVL